MKGVQWISVLNHSPIKLDIAPPSLSISPPIIMKAFLLMTPHAVFVIISSLAINCTFPIVLLIDSSQLFTY